MDIEAEVRAFGGRLRRYRKQAGLSQLALAERAGVDLAAVSFLERAKRAPNLGTLARVARAAGVSPAALLAEEDGAASDGGRNGHRGGAVRRPAGQRALTGRSAGQRAGAGRRVPAADPLQQFGANVRRAREAAGLSQEALAHAARLDRAAISIIEHGGRAANLRTILKLSQALGLAPAQLLADVQ